MLETKTCRLETDLAAGVSPLSHLTVATYNHNGSVLVHGGRDGKLGMTDLHRGELLSQWSGHTTEGR